MSMHIATVSVARLSMCCREPQEPGVASSLHSGSHSPTAPQLSTALSYSDFTSNIYIGMVEVKSS